MHSQVTEVSGRDPPQPPKQPIPNLSLNTNEQTMSAIFDFSSLLTVILLLICTCAYLRDLRPTIFDGGKVSRTRLLLFAPSSNNVTHIFIIYIIFLKTLQPGETRLKRTGATGFFWKMSRIGERLSPYIGGSCAIMAIHLLFIKK